MNTGQVTVLEHLTSLFKEFKDRYESERKATADAFDEFKRGLDEKTKLQAAEYERRLRDLNNETGRVADVIEKTVSADTWTGFQKEFEELKQKVTVEFAAAVGKAQALPYVISIASVLIAIVAAAIVYLRR